MKLLDEAKFIISRYDHYYESINSKSNLYLALNTFIVGGIISGYYTIEKQLHFDWYLKYLFYLILLVNILAIYFTISGLRPFLKRRINNSNNSLYYFGDVAKFSISNYNKSFKCVSEQDLLDDATYQIHHLATGLNKKFNRINVASILIGIQIFLILLFAVILTLIS
jgi:hypothetical protein